MAFLTFIEWCKRTLNLWWGCIEVHEGCDNCYARTLDNRYNGNHWGAKQPRRAIKSAFNDLMRFQRKAQEAGELHTVFCGSMMDIFEKPMPCVDVKGNPLDFDTGYLRDKLFNEYVPQCPNLIFLFLTKRPSNINRYTPPSWHKYPPKNVWFGYSAVNQLTANLGIPELLRVNGNLFLSCEPMTGRIDLTNVMDKRTGESVNALTGEAESGDDLNKVSWVICGGESGHKARPMHPQWPLDLLGQCQSEEATFFFKQWGEWVPSHQFKPVDYLTAFKTGYTAPEVDPLDYGACQLDRTDKDGNNWYKVTSGRFEGETVRGITTSGGYPHFARLMLRVGKKTAGRLLVGNIYDNFPNWQGGEGAVLKGDYRA